MKCRIYREAECLLNARHGNIIDLLAVLPVPSAQWPVLFVMEYVEPAWSFVDRESGRTIWRADMSAWMRSADYLQLSRADLLEDELRVIFHQIFTGVAHMHSIGEAHRELKPLNILLLPAAPPSRPYKMVKICDFGMAKDAYAHSVMDSIHGITPSYLAPEIYAAALDQTSYDGPPVDVWMCGLTLLECLAGSITWTQHNRIILDASAPSIVLGNVANAVGDLEFGDLASPGSIALLKLLLDGNPAARISSAAALQHPWFTGAGLGYPAVPAVPEPHGERQTLDDMKVIIRDAYEMSK